MVRWGLSSFLIAAACSPAWAAAGADSWSAGDGGPHPKAISFKDEGGGTVMTVKLELPKTKVHLARLYASRGPVADPKDLLADIEICAGKAASGKPLALLGPWFNSFDATEAVKAAIEGGGELNLFVKSFPGWQKDETRLEVWFDGKGAQAPPAVKDVKCFHRAGQTFITWKEAKPLVTSDKLTWGQYRQALAEAKAPASYRIYAHDRPITADSILSSQFVAEVEPLSCWNTNGRNMEYLIGQAMIKSDEIGELAFDTGGRMYSWGPDSLRMDRYPLSRFVLEESAGPLAPGVGLYVHTPAAAGNRHYAVVSCVDGVANLSDFSAANAPDKAVAETVGPGEPVCQGDGLWGPFFDYPGQRKVYVQWCGPPLSPLPSMYFNWSVLVPPEHKAVLEPAAPPPAASAKPSLRPVEINFHTGSFSYAKPRQKYLNDSIQIAPHDFPNSGWYGFNDCYGTLKSYRTGTVSNHTQKRIVAFLEWAKAKLPVDPDRIMLPGGDGAVLLALNYPEMFSYVVITGFESVVAPPGNADKRREDSVAKAQAVLACVWGPKCPEIKDDQGRPDWGWAMLDQLVAASPKRDLPLFTSRSAVSWGLHVAAFGKGTGRFYSALGAAGQALTVNWNWGGSAPMLPDRHTGLWRGLDLTRTTPIPAFANCSADGNHDGDGQINGLVTWSNLKETADSFEVTLTGRGTMDMTPRRCQVFKPKGGEKFNWEATPLPDPRVKSQPAGQNGQVAADANGLITVKGISLSTGVAVKITRTK